MLSDTVRADTNSVSDCVLFTDEDKMTRLELIPDRVTSINDSMRSNDGVIADGSGQITSFVLSGGGTNSDELPNHN